MSEEVLTDRWDPAPVRHRELMYAGLVWDVRRDRVDLGREIVERDVLAVAHVAVVLDGTAVEHLAQRGDDALDTGVIRGDAVAHEPVRGRKMFEEIDLDIEVALRLQQKVRRIDACGARPAPTAP